MAQRAGPHKLLPSPSPSPRWEPDLQPWQAYMPETSKGCSTRRTRSSSAAQRASLGGNKPPAGQLVDTGSDEDLDRTFGGEELQREAAAAMEADGYEAANVLRQLNNQGPHFDLNHLQPRAAGGSGLLGGVGSRPAGLRGQLAGQSSGRFAQNPMPPPPPQA